MRRFSIICILGCSSVLILSSLFGASVGHAGDATDELVNPYTRASASVDGVVTSSRSFWRGKRIVTESVIRQTKQDSGKTNDVVVTQPGGTVDGIGMIQFPGLPVLAQGDRVSLMVAALPPADKGIQSESIPARIIDISSLERVAKPTASSDSSDEFEVKFVQTTNDSLAPLYWSSGCIHIKYDSAGTDHIAGDMEFSVIDSVFETWRSTTQNCSYLTFELEGVEDGLEVGADNQNVIKFRDSSWCRPNEEGGGDICYNPSAAALTTLHFINSETSDRNGEILDADIEFNGANFAISVNGITDSDNGCMADLAATMTHEVGHLMGLDHACVATSPVTTSGEPKPWPVTHENEPVPSCNGDLPAAITDSTMYNFQSCGETIKATPEADDTNAICTVYPLASDPNECKRTEFPSGKRVCACTVGAGDTGSPARALGPLLLFGLAMAWRRRRSAKD